MTIKAQLPDGTVLEFPEGTPDNVIQIAVKKQLAQMQQGTQRQLAQQSTPAQQQYNLSSPQQNASDILSGRAPDINTSDISGFGSLAVGFSEGIKDIGRGLGAIDKPTRETRRFVEQLEEERPITQTIGRIAGQIVPFLVPATAVGSIPSLPARIALTGGIGATEGGLIASGTGGTNEEVLQSAGLGGAIGAGAEVAFPVLGRVARQVYSKLGGKTARMVDEAGRPLPFFQQALDDAGIGFDEVMDEARQLNANLNPRQAARLADFQAAGVQPTRGDIMQDAVGGFAQQAEEARLFGSTAEALADPYRNFRLQQSDQFISAVQNVLPDNELGKSVGESIKNALEKDLAILKRSKNAFYKKAAQSADEIGGIPILTDSISSAIPDARTLASISGIEGNNVQAVKDLLTSYNIRTFDDSIERLAAQGVEPTNLNLQNFEEFRKALNRAERADRSGATAVLTGPVKEALDFEMDNLAENMLTTLGKDAPKEVVDSLKSARALVREIKTEFSPQAIAGKLIGTKADRFTPSVEASQVYNQIVGTNKPIEFLERTVKRLKGQGAEGQQAMQSLQAATILDLVESSLNAQTRKVQGAPIFSPVAFNKRLDQIGRDKLKLIFGDNTPEFKKVMQMGRIASSITPPNEAVPKGSSPIILDVIRKLGITSLSTKVPGLSILVEGGQGLAESAATRRSVERAMNATPDIIARRRSELEKVAPALATALAVSNANAQEEQQ